MQDKKSDFGLALSLVRLAPRGLSLGVTLRIKWARKINVGMSGYLLPQQ